jgi:hypothetical protein
MRRTLSISLNHLAVNSSRESGDASPLGDIVKLIWWVVIGLFRSRASLEADLTLRD